MKTLLSLLCLAAIPASAQYAINWSTLDGGGGQSSGGAYTLNGTIGQADAGVSSGGGYTLQGGFWSAFAATVESAPALRIQQSGANVLLSWPDPSTGFELQESPNLSAPAWMEVNAVPAVVGGEKQVSQAISSGARFFRLRKP